MWLLFKRRTIIIKIVIIIIMIMIIGHVVGFQKENHSLFIEIDKFLHNYNIAAKSYFEMPIM